jgi:hypothetical protein
MKKYCIILVVFAFILFIGSKVNIGHEIAAISEPGKMVLFGVSLIGIANLDKKWSELYRAFLKYKGRVRNEFAFFMSKF